MTGDGTGECHHDFNLDSQRQLQNKLLAADDFNSSLSNIDTWSSIQIQANGTLNGNAKTRKLQTLAAEDISGWCSNSKIILRRPERETKSANNSRETQVSNYYKVKRAQDTYVFKHFRDIRKYIQQYRNEHTCLGPPTQTSAATAKQNGDQVRRHTFIQNGFPPQPQNGYSTPNQNTNGHLHYTIRKDNTVAALNQNGSCGGGTNHSPDPLVQGYRYKLTPGSNVRMDTDVSSESERDPNFSQTVLPTRVCSAKLVRNTKGLTPTKVTVPSSPCFSGTRVKQGPLQSLTVQPQHLLKTSDAVNTGGRPENSAGSTDKQEGDSCTDQEDIRDASCISALKSPASCLNTSLQTPHLRYQNASDFSTSPTSMRAECASPNKSDKSSSSPCTYHVLPNDSMLDEISNVVCGERQWNSTSPVAVRARPIAHSEHDSTPRNLRPVVKLATTRIDTHFPRDRDLLNRYDDRDFDAEVNNMYGKLARPTTEKPVRMSFDRQKHLNRQPGDCENAQSYTYTNDSEDGIHCRSLRPEKEGNVDSLQHLARPVPIFSFLVSMGKAGRKLSSAKHRPATQTQKSKSEIDVRMHKLASFVLSGCHGDPETKPKPQKPQHEEKMKKKGPSVASGILPRIMKPESENAVTQHCRSSDDIDQPNTKPIKHRLTLKKYRAEEKPVNLKPPRNLSKVQKKTHHKLNYLKDLPEREYSDVGNQSKSTLLELTESFMTREYSRRGFTRETTLSELHEQRRLNHIIEQLKLKMNIKQTRKQCDESRKGVLADTLAWLEPVGDRRRPKLKKKFKLTITSKQVGFHAIAAAAQKCNASFRN
ncbi:hypothetical protein ScPMuIL_010547 [Solemya velum]